MFVCKHQLFWISKLFVSFENIVVLHKSRIIFFSKNKIKHISGFTIYKDLRRGKL